MLAKLLKHEFIATARILLPVMLAVLVAGALMALMSFISGGSVAMATFTGIFTTLYVIAIIGSGAAVLLVIIQRFWTNLLGREGYLMFTLPVKRRDLIISKLIPAVVWQIVNVIVVAMSLLMIAAAWIPSGTWPTIFQEIMAAKSGLAAALPVNAKLAVIAFAVLLVIGLASNILMAYLSMSLGQLANSGRIVISIAAYFGIYFAVQIIMTVLLVIIGLIDPGYYAGSSEMDAPAVFWGMMAFGAFMSLAWTAIMYFITERLLHKKLNLL